MMKKRISAVLSLFLAITLLIGGSAFAFSDIEEDPGRKEILQLKERKLISGVGKERFGPKQPLNTAHGIVLIVNALKLNLDHLSFIVPPKASDYFEHVSDDAWYADALVIAHYNELDLPKDLDPTASLTKEQFTHYLFKAMLQKCNCAFIELYVNIEDADDIEPAYMDSIQKMIIANIASLDQSGKFHPKKNITRSEAAVMLYRTLEHIKNNSNKDAEDPTMPDLQPNEEVEVIAERIHEDVVKVTLDWGQQPNPGYGISIQRIEFDHGEKTARIIYQLHYPDPDRFYPQVIVHAKAETYVDAEYEIEALQWIDKHKSVSAPAKPIPIVLPVEPPITQ